MTETPVRIIINAQYEQAFDSEEALMEIISVTQFLEEYENYDNNCDVLVGFYGHHNISEKNRPRYTCFTRFCCIKKNLCFYELPEQGIEYYLDRTDGEEDGMIFSITSGTKEIDNNSVNYEFFDEKGRMIMWVTVLEIKK